MSELFAAHPSLGAVALWDDLRAQARGGPEPKVAPSLADFAALYGPVVAPARTPFVIAQLGQSLDGNIATSNGASHYITGIESLVHLHRLRALSDAVVVGWRTVAADDPRLTVRHVTGDNPLRVVVDIAGRLPAHHHAFSGDAPGALRLTGYGVPPLEGVESVSIPLHNGRYAPSDVTTALAARGCKRILIEGGGITVSGFLAARALTRLHIAVAPLITGEGRRGIQLPPVDVLSEALRPSSRYYPMGQDVLFDLDVGAVS